jgi:MFS family permease
VSFGSRSQLAPIYAVQAIDSFAGSLVGIFVPIYLLSLGYPLRTVMVYFLVQDTLKFLSTQATGYLSARVPMRVLMMLSIPLQVAFLALLALTKGHTIPLLLLLAALGGASTALYWIPLNIFFAVGTHKDTTGRQVGTFMALPQMLGIGAPLLAGFVAATLGFNWVFTAAALLAAITAIPMSRIAPYQTPLNFNLAKFRHLFSRYQRYFWLEIVENIQEELDQVIWPLAVYLLVKNTVQAGIAGTLIAAGSALFTYIVGRRTDRADKFRLLHLGAALMLGLWLWRIVHLTPLVAFAASALAGFAGKLITVPFSTIIYGLARDDNTREFVMFREYPVGIARILVYSLGILLAANITQMFWLAVFAYGAFLLLPRFKTAV